MSILADSTVLVAATSEVHPDHEACKKWIESALSRTEVMTAAHALAEVYNTLTKRNGPFQLSPSQAEYIIRFIRRKLVVVTLSGADYAEAIAQGVERTLPGPIIYDILHTMAARKGGAERIATINTRDFVRVWPPSRLIDPRG